MFKGLLPNELDIESCSSDSDIEDTVKKSESVDVSISIYRMVIGIVGSFFI